MDEGVSHGRSTREKIGELEERVPLKLGMLPSTSLLQLLSVTIREPSSHRQLPEHEPRMLLLYFFLSIAQLLVLIPASQVCEYNIYCKDSDITIFWNAEKRQQKGLSEVAMIQLN